MPTITLSDTTVSYTIEERPRRRHPAIQIDQAKRLKVLVPPGFSRNRVEPLLVEKMDWILKHLRESSRQGSSLSKNFVDGEQFFYQGQPLRIRVDRDGAKSPSATVFEHELRVVVPVLTKAHESILVRNLVERWYIAESHRILPKRIEHYVPIVGSRPRGIKIFEYKSRWGYCREDGLIALDWRIVQAPVPVMDYVVVHELTHLRFLHHQKPFWDALKQVLPDFEESKDWLRGHGSELKW